MENKLELYKCALCGNIVEVLSAGAGELVCCGQPLELLVENQSEASKEKHIPMIEKISDGGYIVSVGSVPHPMEEQHHIQWIEFIADDKSYRQFLLPGMRPQAYFCIQAKAITARAYCNLHGLWEKQR